MLQLVLARCFVQRSSSHLSLNGRHQVNQHFRRQGVAIRRKLSNEQNENEKVGSATDKFEEYYNKNNIRDQVFSAISEDGSIKVTACTARNLLNDLMIMHTMTATPADALGRSVVCSLLMSNGMQKEQMLQLTLNTDGPLRGVVAISTGAGEVRGYVGSPMLGDIELQEAVGLGTVQVVKNHPDWPRPYNGISAVRHSDIDRDIGKSSLVVSLGGSLFLVGYSSQNKDCSLCVFVEIGAYLAESEQRSCALAAATSINGILCTAAGGYLIEQLPDAEEDTLAKVGKNLAKLVEKDGGDKLPTNLLLNGVTPFEIADIILDGLGMQPLQQIEPTLVCRCSTDRLVRALRLLSPEEVDDILEKEEKVEARCEFCGKIYSMSPEDVRREMTEAKGDPSKDSDFNEGGK